jgi:hypothetical protein
LPNFFFFAYKCPFKNKINKEMPQSKNATSTRTIDKEPRRTPNKNRTWRMAEHG